MQIFKKSRLLAPTIAPTLGLVLGVQFISVHFSSASDVNLADISVPTTHCTTYRSTILERNEPYCVDRSRPDKMPVSGEPVVFFMHGTNGNEQTWEKNGYAEALKELRADPNLPPMTFVSFKTSPYSFYTNSPGHPKKAWETWFMTEFEPMIEQTLDVCRKRECRAIIGESMGGFGAIKTALRHPELFNTIAVNSPALAPFNPRDSVSKWEHYFKQAPIGPLRGLLLVEIVRKIFPTAESYNENDPTLLVRNYSSPYRFPNIYFDMGGKDYYGFNVGYGIFKTELDSREIPYSTIFEPTAGHDMWKRHAKDTILFVSNHLE
jgi:S-formylglutathione hydrolase FrmB